jgi:hypothetical protein
MVASLASRLRATSIGSNFADKQIGVSNYDQLVGDYTNPILKPQAAEIVKNFGELSLKGITFPSPAN